MACLTLVSCTAGDNETAAGASSPVPTRSSASRGDDPTDRAQMDSTPVHIKIGGRTFSATIRDNPAGAALLERLPVTLTFEDLNGVEKIGKLPEELPMEGMPEGDDPEVGDLGYYVPDGNLVLYYGDVSYWDGIARIGRIDATGVDAIAEQSGDFTATVERND